MSKMNTAAIVKDQYATDANLQLRINFNQKYSTNKQSFVDWMFRVYRLFRGCRILELGCGTGNIWDGRIDQLPFDARLVLSDFSEGMVEVVAKKFEQVPHVSFERISIEDIPYEESTFDVVIANHMLYHVPNIPKAIAEVYRVMKPDGVFYAATNGTKGMSKFLNVELNRFDSSLDVFSDAMIPFTLQNGGDILKKVFATVDLLPFENSLAVTDVSDLVDYIYSSATMTGFDGSRRDELMKHFDKTKNEKGVIEIPIDVGVFVATK